MAGHIAGGWDEDGIYWFKNPGRGSAERGKPWEGTALEAQRPARTRGHMEMFALHDFDADGVPELFSACYRKKEPLEVWRWTRADGAPALTPFVLGAEGGGHGFAFGDVNGDGREDVLTEIGWYERPAGHPFQGPWRLHAETALPHPSCPFAVKDLNRDGRLDILFGRGHDVGLYWWEQRAPKPDGTTVWTPHVIDESWSQAHALALADLDGDGEEELIAGKCVWAHEGGDPGAADRPRSTTTAGTGRPSRSRGTPSPRPARASRSDGSTAWPTWMATAGWTSPRPASWASGSSSTAATERRCADPRGVEVADGGLLGQRCHHLELQQPFAGGDEHARDRVGHAEARRSAMNTTRSAGDRAAGRRR